LLALLALGGLIPFWMWDLFSTIRRSDEIFHYCHPFSPRFPSSGLIAACEAAGGWIHVDVMDGISSQT
jgi:hypothetical protein